MKVYMASVFADKDRVAVRSAELRTLGITPTNRWQDESAPHNCTINDKPDEYFRETAVVDIDDLIAADVLVLTVPSDAEMSDITVRSLARGGRHFETGFFYGLMLAEQARGDFHRQLIILGKRENVFHFLDGKSVTLSYPAVKQMDTWNDVTRYLWSEGTSCRT